MMNRYTLPALALIAGVLGACSPAATTQPAPTLVSGMTAAPPALTPLPTRDPALSSTASAGTSAAGDLIRTDQQGMVVVEVTPLNLDSHGDTLEFDVAMNTHAVDLSMDLAKLSTLTTDTGISVPASSWDAIPGGHHVRGKLVFPAMADGRPVLEGASALTLTIVDVDAPTRTFEWPLK